MALPDLAVAGGARPAARAGSTPRYRVNRNVAVVRRASVMASRTAAPWSVTPTDISGSGSDRITRCCATGLPASTRGDPGCDVAARPNRRASMSSRRSATHAVRMAKLPHQMTGIASSTPMGSAQRRSPSAAQTMTTTRHRQPDHAAGWAPTRAPCWSRCCWRAARATRARAAGAMSSETATMRRGHDADLHQGAPLSAHREPQQPQGWRHLGQHARTPRHRDGGSRPRSSPPAGW